MWWWNAFFFSFSLLHLLSLGNPIHVYSVMKVRREEKLVRRYWTFRVTKGIKGKEPECVQCRKGVSSRGTILSSWALYPCVLGRREVISYPWALCTYGICCDIAVWWIVAATVCIPFYCVFRNYWLKFLWKLITYYDNNVRGSVAVYALLLSLALFIYLLVISSLFYMPCSFPVGIFIILYYLGPLSSVLLLSNTHLCIFKKKLF